MEFPQNYPLRITECHSRVMPEHFTYPWHSLPGYQLYFLLAGRMILEFEERREFLSAGDVLFIPAGKRRRLQLDSGSGRSLVCTFQPQTETAEFRKVHRMNANGQCIKLMRELFSICKSGEKNPSEIAILFHYLCLRLPVFPAMQKIFSPPEKTPRKPAEFLRVVELMRANLCDRLTVNDLCTHFYLSKSSLNRLFLKHGGKSPAEYYRSLRLQEGIRLLEAGITIGEAAFRTGFSSPQHFATALKNQYGRIPSFYKK